MDTARDETRPMVLVVGRGRRVPEENLQSAEPVSDNLEAARDETRSKLSIIRPQGSTQEGNQPFEAPMSDSRAGAQTPSDIDHSSRRASASTFAQDPDSFPTSDGETSTSSPSSSQSSNIVDNHNERLIPSSETVVPAPEAIEDVTDVGQYVPVQATWNQEMPNDVHWPTMIPENNLLPQEHPMHPFQQHVPATYQGTEPFPGHNIYPGQAFYSQQPNTVTPFDNQVLQNMHWGFQCPIAPVQFPVAPFPLCWNAGELGTHAVVAARSSQSGRNRQELIPTKAAVAFDGFLPSSIPSHYFEHKMRSKDENTVRQQKEDERVARTRPLVRPPENLRQGKCYASWSNGYVEVTDELFAQAICPADLLQYPCRFDELPNGCKMLRLCSQIAKYLPGYTCPDAGSRGPHHDEPTVNNRKCYHLHWEVEPSCRFIVGPPIPIPGAEPDVKGCMIVKAKACRGYMCSCGHDFEDGRRIARCRFEAHVKDALLAGAVSKKKAHTVLLSQHPHIEMANGTENFPELLEWVRRKQRLPGRVVHWEGEISNELDDGGNQSQ